ncbi:MAG: permease [Syntrophomonas sp.]
MRSLIEISRPKHHWPYIKLFCLLLILSLIAFSFKPTVLLIDSPAVNSLCTLFLSLLLESLPFLLLGAMISAILEVLVSEDTIARLLPRQTLPGLIVAASLGVFLPLCECGIVIIASRLARKGVPLHLITTFMLAVPLVNPIVVLSTRMAFPAGPMTFYRIFGSLLLAILVGYLVKVIFGGQNVLKPSSEAVHCCVGQHTGEDIISRIKAVLIHCGDEFFSMGSFFVAGAFLSSLFQVAIPRNVITSVGSDSFSAVAVMMALAFGLSLCSNADAFVANAFSSSFSTGALTAFLIYGAMLDLKNSFMLFANFKTRYVVVLFILVSCLVFLYGLSINQIGGFI